MRAVNFDVHLGVKCPSRFKGLASTHDASRRRPFSGWSQVNPLSQVLLSKKSTRFTPSDCCWRSAHSLPDDLNRRVYARATSVSCDLCHPDVTYLQITTTCDHVPEIPACPCFYDCDPQCRTHLVRLVVPQFASLWGNNSENYLVVSTLHSWPRQPARSHTPSTVREGGEAHQVDDDIITPKAAQVRRGEILRLLKQSGKMVNIISAKGERGNVFYEVTVCILVLPSCDKRFDKCKQHLRGNPARLRRPSQN